MNFADPFKVFSGLKGFPHVLYHAMTFGDWNTIVITDRHLDFSMLVGYQDMVVQEMKGVSYTPHVEHVTLREGFKRARTYLDQFTPEHTESREKRLEVPLTWGEDQWKLFCAFRNGTRKKITPLLRKIKVRFETYRTWMRALTDYCTIHTGIYPEGYYTYLTYCFLFSSDYESTLKSVFSSFSTTPFMVEMGENLQLLRDLAQQIASRATEEGIIRQREEIRGVEINIFKEKPDANVDFDTFCYGFRENWVIGGSSRKYIREVL